MKAEVLFVAAEPRECAPFIRHWTEVTDPALPVRWARAGRWKGRQCVAVANGAGVAQAGRAVQAVPEAMTVCSMGFCGALATNLAVGDIFVATVIRKAAGNWCALRPRGPAAAEGVLLTTDRIIATAREKAALRETGCAAVEMEAAAVAAASEKEGAAFYCVKVVSDTAEEDMANDLNACLRPDGSFDTGRLIRGAILSPRRLRELVRFGRRASRAANNLGEYLARCEF